MMNKETLHYGKGLSKGYNLVAPYKAKEIIKIIRESSLTDKNRVYSLLDNLELSSLSGSVPKQWTGKHLELINNRANGILFRTFPWLETVKAPVIPRWRPKTRYVEGSIVTRIEQMSDRRITSIYECVKTHKSYNMHNFSKDLVRNYWKLKTQEVKMLHSN